MRAVVPPLLQRVAQGGHKSVFIASPPKNVRLKWRVYTCAAAAAPLEMMIGIYTHTRCAVAAQNNGRQIVPGIHTRYTPGRQMLRQRPREYHTRTHIIIYVLYILYNRSDYCLGFCAPPPSPQHESLFRRTRDLYNNNNNTLLSPPPYSRCSERRNVGRELRPYSSYDEYIIRIIINFLLCLHYRYRIIIIYIVIILLPYIAGTNVRRV